MGKDKAADAAAAAAARTSLYGAPLVSAKAPVINALPASNQRKQPTANSGNFYQASREDTGNVGNSASVSRQAPPNRLSVPTANSSRSHPSRVNSQRIRRQSGSSQRHLSQVSDQCPDSARFSSHQLNSFEQVDIGSLLFVLVSLTEDKWLRSDCRNFE